MCHIIHYSSWCGHPEPHRRTPTPCNDAQCLCPDPRPRTVYVPLCTMCRIKRHRDWDRLPLSAKDKDGYDKMGAKRFKQWQQQDLVSKSKSNDNKEKEDSGGEPSEKPNNNPNEDLWEDEVHCKRFALSEGAGLVCADEEEAKKFGCEECEHRLKTWRECKEGREWSRNQVEKSKARADSPVQAVAEFDGKEYARRIHEDMGTATEEILHHFKHCCRPWVQTRVLLSGIWKR